MSFSKVTCPPLYIRHKNTNPKQFVNYCQSYVKKNCHGMKAIGVETSQDGNVYILTMPDYETKKPIVKGKGKTKTVAYEPLYKVPIERFLSDDDFEYLRKKGMDKHGNKISK